MNTADTMRILSPMFDAAQVFDWNAASQAALAELIAPRTAADLTVGELLELMQKVAA